MVAKDHFGIPIEVGDDVLINLHNDFTIGTITKLVKDWWTKDS